MKYLHVCGNCARCAQCFYSHAGVACRNYKPSGKEIKVDVVRDVPAPSTVPEPASIPVAASPAPAEGYDAGFSILSFWGNNTNSFYDPERSYDGGGYWQPSGGCLIAVSGRLVVVEYDKYDCGDFGCRRDYVVETPGFRWAWRESNLDGDRDDDRDEVYNSISGVLGVDVEWLLDVARDAVQFAASETWHSRDDGTESAV